MKSKAGAPSTKKKLPNGETWWYDANGFLLKKVDPNGVVRWYDGDGHFHREDGPAYEGPGTRLWYRHGKRHREDGPAVESSGDKLWYRNGKLHWDDGPAAEWRGGRREWYRNGHKLQQSQIDGILEKNAEKIAAPFRTGLDHPITPLKPVEFKKP